MTPLIPALFDVGHSVYAAGAVNAHGDSVDEWAAPVVKKFITWASYDTDEPGKPGHDRDVISAGILVYPDFGVVSPRDRMTIDGQVFEVVGSPERADKAPWHCPVENWRIDLRQVNG